MSVQLRPMLLIGGVGVGKTTLRQGLQGDALTYAKTQAVEVHDDVIDTPGEFLESRFYKHALINASYNSEVVVLVQAADLSGTKFPPGFATAFTRPVVGVITKSGLGTPESCREAEQQLQLAGAQRIFVADAVTGVGIEDLREELCRT